MPGEGNVRHLSRKQKFWAVLGAGLLVPAVSGWALPRKMEDRDVLPMGIQRKSTTSTSPLPPPTLQPTPKPENEGDFTNTPGNDDHGSALNDNENAGHKDKKSN